MSGFAGIIEFTASQESAIASRNAIAGMARRIAFRGPDSQQQIEIAGGSFAFSFLKTGPTAQESSQPFSIDGVTWILGDVRCDGHLEVEQKIRQRGVSLPSNASSEELILHYFEQFGTAGLADLHGDFSFGLWNTRELKLTAYRDLTGPRPFFYSYQDGVFCFSNTIQALLSLPEVDTGLNEEFLGNFLLGFPYKDPSLTVYRGIKRLPPGHALELTSRGLQVVRIANIPIESMLAFRSEQECIEEFQRIFSEAVRDRLPTVNAMISLSGGLDSTTLAACAASLRKSKLADSHAELRAMSVDFLPLFADEETALASEFARKLDIPCDILHFGDNLPYQGWSDMEDPLPEPLLDPYGVLPLLQSRHMAERSRVFLSGMGCDELLRLQAFPHLKYLASNGKTLAAANAVFRYVLAERKLPPLGAGIRTALFSLAGKKRNDCFYPPWIRPEFARRLQLKERWHQLTAAPVSAHGYNPRGYLAMNDLSVGSILENSDATWTGCNCELRVPFLDRRLARFLLRLPPIPWAMDKYLIRRSQIGVLPDSIRLRPKSPVLHDVLLRQIEAKKWNPVDLSVSPGPLENVVNWPLLMKLLPRSINESLYLHLRPFSLLHWLKSVEKHHSIQ